MHMIPDLKKIVFKTHKSNEPFVLQLAMFSEYNMLSKYNLSQR